MQPRVVVTLSATKNARGGLKGNTCDLRPEEAPVPLCLCGSMADVQLQRLEVERDRLQAELKTLSEAISTREACEE